MKPVTEDTYKGFCLDIILMDSCQFGQQITWPQLPSCFFQIQRHFPPSTQILYWVLRSQVPKIWYLNIYNSYQNVEDCKLPCTRTKTQIKFLEQKYLSSNARGSRIDITFSSKVDVHVHDFPKFSISMFLSMFGGTMGLWLGLSVFHLLDFTKTYFDKTVLFFVNKK